MADETLNIKVDDGGSTATVTNNLEKLATSAEGVATSIDKVNGAAATAGAGFNTAAEGAEKAGNAVKGYIDANGNYIRQVGSNATAAGQARTAQDALRSSLSAVSIEQGRAAAGYGALNAATSTSASANAEFNQSVAQLNADLRAVDAAADPAASSTESVGTAAGKAAGSSRDLGAAAGAAAGGLNAAGAASKNAGAAAADHDTKVKGVKASYGAFNETMQDAIRRLGLLAVAFVGVRVADFVTESTNAQRALSLVTDNANETSKVMDKLREIQGGLGVGIGPLVAAYRSGSAAFAALNQSATPLPNLIQQITNATILSGNATGSYSTVAQELFSTFKGGAATAQTLSVLMGKYPELLDLITEGYSKTTAGAGDTTNASDRLTAAFNNGQITITKFMSIFDALVPTLNKTAATAGSTLPVAFNRAYQELVKYLQTNQTAVAGTYALSGALIALSQAPGAVVGALAAVAAAIAAIGLASLIAALSVLGGALATAAGAFVTATAAVTGLSVAAATVVTTVAAVGAGLVLMIGYLSSNVKSINDLANSYGGYNTVIGTVLKNIALIGAIYSNMIDVVKTAISVVAEWAAAALRWAQSFAPVKAAVDGIVSAYQYMKGIVTDTYTSVTTAANQVANDQAAVAASTQTTTGTLDGLVEAGKKLAASFTATTSAASGTIPVINGVNTSMAQMIELDENGNAKKVQFAQSANQASTSLTGLSTAIGATTGSLGAYTGAVGNAANATGTFASAADRLASQLAGTQAGVGEFTQEMINATASMSNLEKSSNSTISALSSVGAAFRQAGADASFFAIQSTRANTVSGQIGGSTASGLTSDWGGLALGGNIPTNSSPSEVIRIMTQRALETLKTDPTNPSAINYLSAQKSLREQAQAAVSGSGYKAPEYNADGTLKASEDLTAANTNNTSATAANTAALNANTRASTAAATNLPDLVAALDPRNKTTVSGLGANGRPTVGTTVTQTNYLTPMPAAVNDTGPSQDVINRLNGGFAPGAAGPMGQGIAAPTGFTGAKGPMGPVNITIQADDYGQFQRSQRQIAQDIGMRVAMASN